MALWAEGKHQMSLESTCKTCGQRIIYKDNTWVVSSNGTYWGFCGNNPSTWTHIPQTKEQNK